MRLYSVTDGYIDYLHSEHKHVYSNKEDSRLNSRKYIGIVMEIGNYKYFVPLSSPKESDYEQINGERQIRKDSFLILRIVSSGERKNAQLKGTIRIANMIPVPDSELLLYDVDHEIDRKYKDLVQEELEYIRKNKDKIQKRAKTIYNKKKCGNAEKIMQFCLDYQDLERMHDEWISFMAKQGE